MKSRSPDVAKNDKSRKRKSRKRHNKQRPQTLSAEEVSCPEQQRQEEVEEDKPSNSKRRKILRATNPAFHSGSSDGANGGSASKKMKQPKQKSSFLDKMRMRLSGGHFRMLNEQLYTCSGIEAFNLFKKDPELFNVYHAGYQEQMSRWPEQPVNTIIRWLKSHSTSLRVADFGCGSATLAKSVKNKVFSIDLVSNDPLVIACDMSRTPLNSSSVDVAVFCLSLMGTNYPSYLREASRVLRPCGWLLIAEVRSRFDPKTNGADPEKFCEAINQLGFSLVSKDFTNKMFVLFYFNKTERTSEKGCIEWPELKPCIYKRR